MEYLCFIIVLSTDPCQGYHCYINIALSHLVAYLCCNNALLGAKDCKRTKPSAPILLKHAKLHGGRRRRTYNIFLLNGLTIVARNTHLGPVLNFKRLLQRHLLSPKQRVAMSLNRER